MKKNTRANEMEATGGIVIPATTEATTATTTPEAPKPIALEVVALNNKILPLIPKEGTSGMVEHEGRKYCWQRPHTTAKDGSKIPLPVGYMPTDASEVMALDGAEWAGAITEEWASGYLAYVMARGAKTDTKREAGYIATWKKPTEKSAKVADKVAKGVAEAKEAMKARVIAALVAKGFSQKDAEETAALSLG